MNTDYRFNSRKFKRYEILITFQRSGPDYWNVSLRRTYAQNVLYMVFKVCIRPIYLFIGLIADYFEGAIKTIIGSKTDLIFLYMKLLLNSTCPMIHSSIIIVYI